MFRKRDIYIFVTGCSMLVLILYTTSKNNFNKYTKVADSVAAYSHVTDLAISNFITNASCTPKFLEILPAPVRNIEELNSRAHFDISGMYKIISHVEIAQHWKELVKRPMCIAIQSSLDRVDHIVELASNWPGAISLALYAPGHELALALHYLTYLKRCFHVVHQRVNVHLAYPAYIKIPQELEPDIHAKMLQWECSGEPKNVLNYLLSLRTKKTMNWRTKMLYPQNMLRNIAREHCHNEWITCPDIDMVFPSPNDNKYTIAESLEVFLVSSKAVNCSKCAFVLPTYEIQKNYSQIPRNKTELLQYIHDGKVRRYHKVTYEAGQKMSNLAEWEKLATSNMVNIAYPAAQFKWRYEPIYIARKGTPRFDERYVGYGTVRVEQAFEMFLAGYTFQILNNVFLIHRGFKEKGYISRYRRKQMNKNWQEFRNKHLRELVVRYDSDPLGLLKQYSVSQSKKQVQINLQKLLPQ